MTAGCSIAPCALTQPLSASAWRNTTWSVSPFTTMFEDGAMPLAGRSGTLDDHYGRFVTRHARCAQGAVTAKTGTLFDTVGLSGVARRPDGSERIFSILVNDRPQRVSTLSTRQAVDGLAATVVGCWN